MGLIIWQVAKSHEIRALPYRHIQILGSFPILSRCLPPRKGVFGPELTYVGADDNHAAASGSGCSCLSAEGSVVQNRAGTDCHLPSNQLWVTIWRLPPLKLRVGPYQTRKIGGLYTVVNTGSDSFERISGNYMLSKLTSGTACKGKRDWVVVSGFPRTLPNACMGCSPALS